MAGVKGQGRFAKDLTGQTFSELTVISKARTNKNGRAVWNVKCSCGEITFMEGRDMRSGRVKSCGHLKRERVRLPDGRFQPSVGNPSL